MLPLQVVLFAHAKIAGYIATRGGRVLTVDGCLLINIVAQFLILRQESRFSLIACALKPFSAFCLVNLRAMSAYMNLDGILVVEVRCLLETVVVLHRASQVDGCGIQGHRLILVAGIVNSNSAHLAMQFLDVFHQYVAFALLLCHVRLQVKRILVEGDEVFVAEQFQRFGLDIGHITPDE